MSQAGAGNDYQVFLLPLFRRWKWFIGCMLIGLIAASALAFATPKKYTGSVTFFVSTLNASAGSSLNASQFGQDRVATYARLLSSQRLGEMIKDDTNSNLSAKSIAKRIDGNTTINTVILTATLTDTNERRTQELTEALARQMPVLVTEVEGTGENDEPRVSLVVVSGPDVDDQRFVRDTVITIGLGLVIGGAVGAVLAVIVDLRARFRTGGKRARQRI